MPKYTTINDGLLAHLNEMVDAGWANDPQYDQDISSVIMAISDAYEVELTSEQKEELPSFDEMDRHQPGDAIYRLLKVVDTLIRDQDSSGGGVIPIGPGVG